MRTDTPVANGDPAQPSWTARHVVQMLQEACPRHWQTVLRNSLGSANPANLPPVELAKFTDHVFWVVKQYGIKDPAAFLAYQVKLEAEAAAAKLEPSPKIGDIAAQGKAAGPRPVERENSPAETSAASPPPPPAAQTAASETTKVEEERQPDHPAANAAPQMIANPEVTNPEAANARDEIVIDGRRLFGERRVAEMLGRSRRTLQRGRREGKGPPSTKIGRKVYYDLKDLLEWIDRGKIR